MPALLASRVRDDYWSRDIDYAAAAGMPSLPRRATTPIPPPYAYFICHLIRRVKMPERRRHATLADTPDYLLTRCRAEPRCGQPRHFAAESRATPPFEHAMRRAIPRPASPACAIPSRQFEAYQLLSPTVAWFVCRHFSAAPSGFTSFIHRYRSTRPPRLAQSR